MAEELLELDEAGLCELEKWFADAKEANTV
jgi:hypothetical protein